LAADTHGERLEPLEVLFLERFEALGHQAEWIPRPPFVPGVGRPASSDFLWVDMDGLRIELKSPARPLYRVVKDKIHKDVAAARRWGLSAENYIIDLGYRPLTAKLAAQLADYNANTATTAITRLWVMSRNGADLTRIHLKKAK
jgi:hypothetical protein